MHGFLLSATVAALTFTFTLAHAQTGIGEARLEWQPPTHYEDGSELPLEDIAGYAIFYGPASREGRDCDPYPESREDTSCYPASVWVGNGAVQSRSIDIELTEPTTLYFAAITETVAGLRSAYSGEASAVITLEEGDEAPLAPTNLTLDLTLECTPSQAGRWCRFTVE